MKIAALTTFAALTLGGPAFAAGDAAAGEALFRQCQACHVVANEAGEVLAGRPTKVAPNLYAVAGRMAGSYPEFKYGDALIAAGAKGLVWDEASFVTYVLDPSAFLKTYLDDPAARGKMLFKVKTPEDAADLYAYLGALAPQPEAPAEAPAEAPEDAQEDEPATE